MVDFTTISPHIFVKISPTAKRLALRLDSRARRINLVIPQRASLKKAYEFAELNQDWINSKINALPQPVPYIDGTILPMMGAMRTLRILHSPSKITRLTLTDTDLVVTTHLDDVAPRISRYLKSLAAKELGHLAHAKAARLNKRLSHFTVRDMKSRWGSCSIDGRMTLSWRLLFAPMAAIDYVISHEAAHLIHPNHGPDFWALCESLCLDFRAGHDWMRRNGINLGRYGETPLMFSPDGKKIGLG